MTESQLFTNKADSVFSFDVGNDNDCLLLTYYNEFVELGIYIHMRNLSEMETKMHFDTL